eukprot:scaffold4719_cov314-Pinguiococcus_pyrenoidosus.AAC.2
MDREAVPKQQCVPRAVPAGEDEITFALSISPLSISCLLRRSSSIVGGASDCRHWHRKQKTGKFLEGETASQGREA